MKQSELCCPHGKHIVITEENGMVVYLHALTGEYCTLMNSFDITPEEILQEMIRTILDENKFLAFDEVNNNCFHEFVIIFKWDPGVREQVYEKIAALSGSGGNVAGAKKLFAVVLTVLSDPQIRLDERKFKALVSELFVCYGLAFEKALEQMENVNKKKFEPLRLEMEFQKKYVHSMQDADKYDINSWI